LKVLGIETSCDDTSFAVFSKKDGVIGNLTANQLVHDRYGGVVPEIASREHVKNLLPVFESLLERCRLQTKDIGGIGVTNGPGLIGSLLVGVGFAKSLALALQRPVVGVHHIEAHILSNEIESEALNTPAVVLVVSGGHTSLYYISRVGSYELVGNTRDDAAGECFDKIAKLLGLGFPGGPAVERIAQSGDRDAVAFPRAMMIPGNQDFSFSGLKTAVRFHVEAQSNLDQKMAANGRLREQMAHDCAREGIAYHAPLLEFCADNGAMVACAAERHLALGRNDGFGLDVFARGPIISWADGS
jgi:N6-L-threonylcarbamoyladenine synthase